MTISKSLTEFIGCNVDSIETLEILMLLQRAPDTFWTAVAIESQLGMRSGVSGPRLDSLCENGLIVRGFTAGGYRYSPGNEALRSLVEELATAYADSRAVVLNAVHSEHLDRLRAFADAFRMKSE
ncbi:MAG: hypothetical protein ACRD3J_01230 [Thermoanaerobaculia bacterium]